MKLKGFMDRKLTKDEAAKLLPVLLVVTVACSLLLTALIQFAITAALGGNV